LGFCKILFFFLKLNSELLKMWPCFFLQTDKIIFLSNLKDPSKFSLIKSSVLYYDRGHP